MDTLKDRMKSMSSCSSRIISLFTGQSFNKSIPNYSAVDCSQVTPALFRVEAMHEQRLFVWPLISSVKTWIGNHSRHDIDSVSQVIGNFSFEPDVK